MRYNKHELAIAILTEYDRIKPSSGNKYNMLGGRTGNKGTIELNMQTAFTADERAVADRVFNDLQEMGQLVPDYSQMISPGEWFNITDTGERALQSGAIDELDTLLLNLQADDDLLQLRYGAHDAVFTQNTDWPRHAATSCRELITKTLHTIAPDNLVTSDPYFTADTPANSGITRKQRIKYYLRQKTGAASRSDTAVIEKSCDLVEACYTKLSVVTHTDAQGVENLIRLTEEALYFLLK